MSWQLFPPAAIREPHPYEASTWWRLDCLIHIENLAGSVRRGVGDDGKPWRQPMHFHYGEFHGTVGHDGDPLDCYLGPDPNAPTVYVVHQRMGGGPIPLYDEAKVMLGFRSAADALTAYRVQTKPGLFVGLDCIGADEFYMTIRNVGALPGRLVA